MKTLEALSVAIQKGLIQDVADITMRALAEKFPPERILEEGMIQGMGIIGERFKNNDIFVPEMLIAARAMNLGLEILEPAMVKCDEQERGTIVIGTVSGDLHDIGKNLVGIMFKGAGYNVIDLGVDVSASSFIEAISVHNASFVGLSALLTTTMMSMKHIVSAVKEAHDHVNVLIGGAPVTENYALEISADGYADSAAFAVDVAQRLEK